MYYLNCDSGTLSTLCMTYGMNIYGCQTWIYNSHYLDKFYTTWRKAICIMMRFENEIVII